MPSVGEVSDQLDHRDPSNSKLPKHGSPCRSARGRDAALRTLLIAGIAILGAIGCYRRLLFGGSLHNYDWHLHWYYYDWIRTSLTQFGTLPLYMKDALHSSNFLGNPQSPVLGPFVWLLYFLPTDMYIRTLIVLYAAAGLTGLVALLLDLGVEWPIAAVLAVMFGFNGFFVSHLTVGHHWSLGSFLLPPILFLYRRAALGRWMYLWCAVALNICVMFEGYHHPFIWNNVFLALYGTAWAVQTRSVAPLKTLTYFFAASAGVGAVKLLPMYAEFASYVGTDGLPGFSPAWIPWSLFGLERDAFNIGPASCCYWEYNFYIGSIAGLLLLVGIPAGGRRAWPWLAAGVFFLFISLDLSTWQWTPEPWSMIRHWPVWRSQRCPSRFVIVALTAFLIAAGIGLQTVWESTRIRRTHPRVLLALAAVTMVGAFTELDIAASTWLPLALGTPLPHYDHAFNAVAVPPGTATLMAAAPNREVYEVDMPIGASGAAFLRLPDPHWHLQRHTDLSPGKEEVVLVYTPPFFCLGAVVSLASCIAAIASAVWGKQRLRR